MAIAYFPQIYEDELIYSLLARLKAHSGIVSYRDTAKMIYQNPYVRPSTDFINNLTLDASNLITAQKSMNEVIEHHTMFNMYMRFYPSERKKVVFNSMLKQDSSKNILPVISYKKSTRVLRYCPICVKEDRLRVGETYWHRCHQLYGVDVCYLHNCRLKQSKIAIDGKMTPQLVSAEEVVGLDDDNKIISDEIIIGLAQYQTAIFTAHIDLETELDIKTIFDRYIDKKYHAVGKICKNIINLYEEYRSFYSSINLDYLMDKEQFVKVLSGDRKLSHGICQIAFWLNIDKEVLLIPMIDVTDDKESIVYREIADKLGYEYEIVKKIGEEIISQMGNKISNRRAVDIKEKWKKMDVELLPKVRDILQEIKKQEETERPVRITIAGVQKQMKLPDKRFEKLPMCKAEIEKYMESQKQYWAREIVWAVRELQKDNKELSIKKIRTKINLRTANIMVALEELEKINMDTYKMVCDLL